MSPAGQDAPAAVQHRRQGPGEDARPFCIFPTARRTRSEAVSGRARAAAHTTEGNRLGRATLPGPLSLAPTVTHQVGAGLIRSKAASAVMKRVAHAAGTHP